MAMSLLLVPLAMMLDLLGGGQNFAATVMAFVAAALIFLFFFVVFPMSIRGQARRAYLASADYHKPVAMDFYPSVMVTSYRYTRHTIGYESIVSCCETTSHFCFFENRYTMLGQVLPKSSLTAQEVDALRSTLQRDIWSTVSGLLSCIDEMKQLGYHTTRRRAIRPVVENVSCRALHGRKGAMQPDEAA